jgi:DNA-directed RNA polymerase specialized sigma24 family protein
MWAAEIPYYGTKVMPLSSPSGFCWNVKFPPEQEWIEQAVLGAIEIIWQRAQKTARSRCGDVSLARELMEVAIQKTVDRLQAGSLVGPDEASRLLYRIFVQEARCRQNATRKLVSCGSNAELPPVTAQNPFTPVDSAIDLDVILHGEAAEVRHALLLRHSRSSWTEVATILGTTAASIRVRCNRALKRIRQRWSIHENDT